MHTFGKPELSENQMIRPVPRPSGLQRVYCIEKNAPPTGGHVFSPIWTIFELVRDINKTNVLTNFHDDWAKNVTSRVFTRFLYSQIRKTAPIRQPCYSTDRNHFRTQLSYQENKCSD
ncbi:hypothetical protein DPMN_188301 [Dreissena polymorpha]|uniref:Uncharacterized protein n=1 Tax=Dreissena polymorpha TaxID=45954 RepID=A0A9D4DQJ6_DREPO|nr:hypothetical protein DPMN_188301 [Dreissena polymorpha]